MNDRKGLRRREKKIRKEGRKEMRVDSRWHSRRAKRKEESDTKGLHRKKGRQVRITEGRKEGRKKRLKGKKEDAVFRLHPGEKTEMRFQGALQEKRKKENGIREGRKNSFFSF